MSAYPDRTPFPSQATMTIEARLTYSLDGVPTVPREVMTRLIALTRRYLDDDPAERSGRAVAIPGRHGTGKSHTLLAALASATDPEATGPGRTAPLALYVRAEAPDPVLLYRKLMAQLSLVDLQQLVENAFAGYAAREYAETRDGVEDTVGDPVTESLRQSPKDVQRAVRAKGLSWSALVTRQEEDIKRIQPSLGRFERPVRALLQPARSTAAHQWLIGAPMDQDALKTLGVESAIDDADAARLGVHVLAMLARAGQRPFILVLDQVESLVNPDDTLDAGNTGWVRGLVEAVSSESGFIVVAMSSRAWKKLPPDLPMRFGQSVIPVRGLTIDEAEAVLDAYLAPWHPDPPLFPFQPDAIRPLLVHSGGNVRRFLQTCHLVFDKVAPERKLIDAKTVRLAIVASPQRPPTEEEVRHSIERVLTRTRSGFRADLEVDGVHVDYALMRGSRPALYVQLSESVFAQEEAESAVVSLTTIRLAREQRVPIVLVVLGYSSPEVTSKLEQVATSVLVAEDARRFEEEVAQAIGQGVEEAPSDVGVLLEGLDDLRAEFAKLAELRGRDEQLVDDRLRIVDTELSEAERTQQLREHRQAWAKERERLQDEVDRRRAERRQRDVQEVVDLHREEVAEGRQRLLLIGAATILIALVVVSALVASSAVILTAPVAVLAVVALAVTERLARRRATVGTVSSVADLERAARDSLQRVPGGARLIRHPDPYLRYGVALTVDEGVPAHVLLGSARAEPAALVRRRFLQAAIARDPEVVGEALRADLDPGTMAIAVEAAARGYGPWDALDERVESWPEALQTVAAIAGAPTKGHGFLDDFLAELREGGSKRPDLDAPHQRLALAFSTDDDSILLQAVASLPERYLRRCIALLSPFDDEGLGSWYWLHSADFVEELFFFFRKATFLAAGGLAPPAPVAPAAAPEHA
jgi:Skp family chaperone for outer membrane proteins